LAIAVERVGLQKKSVSSDALLNETWNAHSVESLGVLASGVAHDFNNILSIILSNARAFGKKSQNDASIRNMIIKATERAVLLTRQLMEYSGKGYYPLRPIPDLSPFLVKTIDELNSDLAAPRSIGITHSQDPLPVYVDVSQIMQLIKNLVINAVEAVDKNGGEVQVHSRLVDTSAYSTLDTVFGDPIPEGECVAVTVKDTGCGIPEKDLAKVFEPFYTTKFIGRGLGLSAVLGIVRRHGGSIHIESVVDKGTEVTIYLPMFRLHARDIDSSHPAVLSFGTILVVDDDEICRAMARTMLDKLGFSTLVAKDGVDALAVFKENADRIDCILLDIVMPRMNGQSCFREIRKLNGEVPIIMVSGYDYYDAVQSLSAEKLNGFITKLYRLRKIASVLSEVLRVELSIPAIGGSRVLHIYII
jgi:two-component system, cell cycle sensor histidine kinase and response regulator CckA